MSALHSTDRPALAGISADAPARFLNRELSQLAFNRRVLALAQDESLALLERAKFLAISSQILDEFFQVRVAGLRKQSDAGVGAVTPEGLTPERQLEMIREEVLGITRLQMDIFSKQLLPALAEAGLRMTDWVSLSGADRVQLGETFEQRIFPVLTPLSVDPAHPFPYISNLSSNLAVVLYDAKSDEHRFARLKVPPVLPRFFVLPDGQRFLPIEDLIAAHLDQLFPGMEIVSHFAFRVTRDAELEVEEEEADDLLRAIESSIMRRRRMNDVVRVEVDASMSEQVRRLLERELEIDPDEVYVIDGPLDLGGLRELQRLNRPDLKEEVWPALRSPQLPEEVGLFDAIRQGDVLVHHPYESFGSSIQEFLSQASRDPKVLAIKNTVYRTSQGDNEIAQALARAAHAGKEVVALIELQARFDEEANIEWARALEQVGVHVVFGIVGLKTHAKATLVVRQEADGIRRYCHVSTGNYHPQTATMYEDVGLLSADPELTADVSQLFNYLTGFARPRSYRKVMLAPSTLRERILELIREEMRTDDGRVIMKLNSLSDSQMIDSLYEASCAGVEIDLIVRGICCLRPGIPGLSERIRVRSILGRYLEHSRVLRFGSDARGPRYFIGSADIMRRNLDRRIELVVPIESPEQQRRVEEILRVNLSDDIVRWELGADGNWTRRPEQGGASSQERLQRLAQHRGRLEEELPEER